MSSGPVSIVNGRLIDPANGIDAIRDIHLADGRVRALGPAPDGFEPQIVVDARGQVVCPGLIDLSARLREPGEEHKATIASESRAAAASGITTLCCPPDTDPIVESPAVVELIRQRANRIGLTRVIVVGAMSRDLAGEQLSEMAALKGAGCGLVSNGDRPFATPLIQRRALEYATTFGLTAVLRPVEASLHNHGCVHEGRISARLGLPGIPAAAETVAVARDLALVEQTRARIHFRGLSSGVAARMVGRAQYEQLPVSADVAVHQLHLSEIDVDGFDAQCHFDPPLRTTDDRDALRRAVADGTITAICSDHRPHEPDAKENPFPATSPGASGLETLLPLTLKLVAEGVLSLNDAIARLTCGPAGVIDASLGRLEVGAVADLCLFDPARAWILDPARMVSRGRNTPFAGWELTGKVTHTFLEGRLVYTEARD